MEKKKMFLLRSTLTRATDVTIATVLWFDWLKKRQWKILTKKQCRVFHFVILNTSYQMICIKIDSKQ
jgi:hypothetical protein